MLTVNKSLFPWERRFIGRHYQVKCSQLCLSLVVQSWRGRDGEAWSTGLVESDGNSQGKKKNGVMHCGRKNEEIRLLQQLLDFVFSGFHSSSVQMISKISTQLLDTKIVPCCFIVSDTSPHCAFPLTLTSHVYNDSRPPSENATSSLHTIYHGNRAATNIGLVF